MTTNVSEILIRKPADVVFDYVTTPAHWLQRHPSSVALRGATDHSLHVGEEVTEDFRVAGRAGSVTWKVVARDRPTRWTIAGKVVAGGSGTITYTLRESSGSTEFRREFVYAMPNRFGDLLDRLFVRRRITAESALALNRLQQALEST